MVPVVNQPSENRRPAQNDIVLPEVTSLRPRPPLSGLGFPDHHEKTDGCIGCESPEVAEKLVEPRSMGIAGRYKTRVRTNVRTRDLMIGSSFSLRQTRPIWYYCHSSPRKSNFLL